MEKNFDAMQSTFQLEVNKLNKMVTYLGVSLKNKKLQITQYNNFTHKLLMEGRITKEELAEYIKRKPKNNIL